MSLRTTRRAYRAELFGGKRGEITKRYILGEDVKFKNNKKRSQWWKWFKKLTSSRKERHEKFYCWICHTFKCKSKLHKRMEKNAIKYGISRWQFYSSENKARLIKEGHFKCPTFKRNYEQTEILLKGRLAILFGLT